ncbi:hypothetical protein HQ560_16875, partial [bacterium]|nr:hypothetical protein [bacterium]
APGQYSALIPAEGSGVWHAMVIDESRRLLLQASTARSFSREWEAFGVDRAALMAIAQAGRGDALESLTDLEDVAPDTAGSYAALDRLLALTALAVFVLGVALDVVRLRRAPI